MLKKSFHRPAQRDDCRVHRVSGPGGRNERWTGPKSAFFRRRTCRSNPAKRSAAKSCITAALREMQSREDVTVKFTLAGDRHTYETTVIVTPDSEDEEGLLSATASFENLLSGAYQLYIEEADGASLDYILAEKGGESKYTMQEDSITFYLSEEASSGSAWFMMQEETPGREHGEAGR